MNAAECIAVLRRLHKTESKHGNHEEMAALDWAIQELEDLPDQVGRLVFDRDEARVLAEQLYNAIDDGLGPTWWRGHCQAARQAYEKRSWKVPT